MHVPVYPAEKGGGDQDEQDEDQDDFGQNILERFQVRVVDGQTSIAPVLMRYQRGCQQVSAPLTTFVERYRQIVHNISYQRGCQQTGALLISIGLSSQNDCQPQLVSPKAELSDKICCKSVP